MERAAHRLSPMGPRRHPHPHGDRPYGYFWWIDAKRPDRFYAFGNYRQYIYLGPRADVVAVRLDSDWGFGNEAWLATFRAIGNQLADCVDSETVRGSMCLISPAQSAMPMVGYRVSLHAEAIEGRARSRRAPRW